VSLEFGMPMISKRKRKVTDGFIPNALIIENFKRSTESFLTFNTHLLKTFKLEILMVKNMAWS
jgi:hypothetical protein